MNISKSRIAGVRLGGFEPPISSFAGKRLIRWTTVAWRGEPYLGTHPNSTLFSRNGGCDDELFLRGVEQPDHEILHQSGLVH